MALPIGGGIYQKSITIPATFNIGGEGLWQERRIRSSGVVSRRTWMMRVFASSGSDATVPNSNYVVPLDSKSFSSSSCVTRPLAEILRDLNKRIPDNIITKPKPPAPGDHNTFIPWYHANRMLSFYAPGTIYLLVLSTIIVLYCTFFNHFIFLSLRLVRRNT